MKKITSILLVVLLVLTCVSMFACNKPQDTPTPDPSPDAPFDTEKAQSTLAVYIFEQDGQAISGEFTLPGKIGEFSATWTSSDPIVKITEIPASEGIERQYLVEVGYPEEVTDVILTVALSDTVKKTFTVVVNPLSVHDFINAYTFEHDRTTVTEDFDLDQSVDYAGKTATITWSADSEYLEISEDGTTCIVYPTSLNPTVSIKATFSFNGETATKTYKVTVSEVKEHLQEVDYWYSNTGVNMTMKGYVVEIATVFNPSYGNISLYIVDEDFCAGYYLYRVLCDQATADRLVPGTPVICTGSTNTAYNGLYETNEKTGTIVVDETREAINVEDTIYAIDNEIIGDLQAAYYHQSALVSLTNWTVKEVKAAPTAASSTETLFVLTKGGVDVPVVVSKYHEGSYIREEANSVWAGLCAHGIQAGDIVSVTGILGNYKGAHQIAVRSMNDIVKGGTADAEGTVYPGVTAKTAVDAIDAEFEKNGLGNVVAKATSFTIPTVDGVEIEGSVIGGSAVAIDNGKLSITPGRLENACVRFDITVGDFSTVIFRYIQSADLDDAGKLAMERTAFELDVTDIIKNSEIELPTVAEIFSEIAIAWSFKADTEHDCATLDGNVLTVTLPAEATTITLVATFSLGEAEPVTKEFNIAVSQRRALENKVTGAELTTIPALNEIGAGITSGESEDKYLVIGYVDEIANTQYGNLYITDAEGNRLYVYGTYNYDGTVRFDAMTVKPALGDVVVLYGAMTSYKGSPQMKNGQVMQINDTVYGNVETAPECTEHVDTNPEDNKCDVCGADLTPVQTIPAPAAGTYKMYLVQATLSKTLYWDGNQDSSERFSTTEDVNAAAIITIAKVGENAYTLKAGDKFIELYYIPDTTSDRPHMVDVATGTWAWDATLGVFTWNLEGTLHYLGTYNNFNTISPSELSYISGANAANIGVSQFVCQYEAYECNHTYDNACDATCNICGGERTVGEHVYDHACDTECNECGATREPGEHVDTAEPKDCYCDNCQAQLDHVDENSDNKCDNCGTDIIPLCTGEHTYTDDCDEQCDVCPFVREDAPHKYDNACDGECECGATRTPADHVDAYPANCVCDVCAAALDHTYDNACDANCNVCNEARTPADHVYDNACTDTECNVCSATREVPGHSDADTDGLCDGNCGLVMTIAKALEAGSLNAKAELTGTVVGLTTWSTQYNNWNVTISDGTNLLLVFRCTNNEVGIGDIVKVVGTIGVYNDVNQIAQGSTLTIVTAHTCTMDPATCTDPATCPVCGATEGEALDHTDVDPADGTCDVCQANIAASDSEVTASKSIADLIVSEGWTTSTTKQTFKLDDNVTVKVDGGSNTGKAYDGDHIRIYATDSPAGTLTISVPEGYELVSVKVSTLTGTYAFLYLGEGTTDISNVETAVSGQSVVLNSVKNGTNGKQVRVTAIEVTYRPVSA